MSTHLPEEKKKWLQKSHETKQQNLSDENINKIEMGGKKQKNA